MKLIIKAILSSFLALALALFSASPDAVTSVALTDGATALECATVKDDEVKIGSRLAELFFGKSEPKSDAVLLIAGGGIFGAKIKQSYVSVQSPGDVRELKAGDKILSVSGTSVSSAAEVKSAIQKLVGKDIELVVERDGKEIKVCITPKKASGEYKLGLVLKDGAAGIGTITYIDPQTGEFGGLGHGICDTDTGEIIDFTEGQVTGVILSGVKKGEEGKPGELSGMLTDKVSGVLYSNTECGVFGKLDKIPEGATPIEIAHRGEVHDGEATILSTVKSGGVKEFKIEILDVNKSSTGTKSFRVKVTDPALLAITGGVVRGMSGSPIIQDGKLVGAVTHVMVANPTEGYGIFIENMLNASVSTRNELPAA